MNEPSSRPNLVLRLVVAAAAVFIITILAMVASLFGDPAAPMARFFDKYCGTLIAVEAAVTVLLTLGGLTLDRLATLREIRRREEAAFGISSGDSPPADRP